MIIILIGILISFIILLIVNIKVIKPMQVGVKIKRNKEYELLNPGYHLVIPIWERLLTIIDTCMIIRELGGAQTLAKDNITLDLEVKLLYQIKDIKKYVESSKESEKIIDFIVMSSIKNVICTIYSYEVVAMIEDITLEVIEHVKEELLLMGIHLEKLELYDIKFPKAIKAAYEEYNKATIDMQKTLLEEEYKKKCLIVQTKAQEEKNMLELKGEMQTKERLYLKELELKKQSMLGIYKMQAEGIKIIKNSLDVELSEKALEQILSIVEKMSYPRT